MLSFISQDLKGPHVKEFQSVKGRKKILHRLWQDATAFYYFGNRSVRNTWTLENLFTKSKKVSHKETRTHALWITGTKGRFPFIRYKILNTSRYKKRASTQHIFLIKIKPRFPDKTPSLRRRSIWYHQNQMFRATLSRMHTTYIIYVPIYMMRHKYVKKIIFNLKKIFSVGFCAYDKLK